MLYDTIVLCVLENCRVFDILSCATWNQTKVNEKNWKEWLIFHSSFIIHFFIATNVKRIRRYIWLKHITIMLLGK